MKISIGSALLFDHAWGDGSALFNKQTPVQRVVEVLQFIDSPEIKTRYRGNKQAPVRFSVSRPCADEADVLVRFYSHEATIPPDQAMILRDTGETVIVAIPGNLLTVTPRHVGTRIFYDYEFLGGIPVVLTGAALGTIMMQEDGTMLLNEDGMPLRSS